MKQRLDSPVCNLREKNNKAINTDMTRKRRISNESLNIGTKSQSIMLHPEDDMTRKRRISNESLNIGTKSQSIMLHPEDDMTRKKRISNESLNIETKSQSIMLRPEDDKNCSNHISFPCISCYCILVIGKKFIK